MQPTMSPTGQPTMQPSTQPTSSPSSAPTLHGNSLERIYENGTVFSLSRRGIHFIDTHVFTYVGKEGKKTFLSGYVWDTGFGPSSQQWAEFSLSGLPSTPTNPIRTPNGTIQCAPRKNGENGCLEGRGEWHNCFYNYDVSDYIDTASGGTLTINIISHGVLSSACPHVSDAGDRDPVYVRYVLSTEIIPTPEPTMAPTARATKGDTNVFNNGVNVDLGEVNFFTAMQISFAIAVIFAAFGVAMTKVAEHTTCRAYQPRLIKAAFELGLVGADVSNFIFLMLELASSGFIYFAYAMTGVRLLDSIVAISILSAVYGGKELQERSGYAHLLDRKHMLNGPNANIYAVCSFVTTLDPQILAYLPWFNSPFSRMSQGYPNMFVFRVVSISTLCSTFAFIGLQIPYLLLYRGDTANKGFSALSMCFNCVRLFFAILTYVVRASSLQAASTEPDLEELKQWELRKDAEKKRKEEEANVPSIGPYTMNPLFLADEREATEEMASAAGVSDLSSTDDIPLHRPSGRFAEVDEGDDEEYDSIYGVNPMHGTSNMSMPSIKGKTEISL